MIEPAYKALGAFARELYSTDLVYRHKLQPVSAMSSTTTGSSMPGLSSIRNRDRDASPSVRLTGRNFTTAIASCLKDLDTWMMPISSFPTARLGDGLRRGGGSCSAHRMGGRGGMGRRSGLKSASRHGVGVRLPSSAPLRQRFHDRDRRMERNRQHAGVSA